MKLYSKEYIKEKIEKKTLKGITYSVVLIFYINFDTLKTVWSFCGLLMLRWSKWSWTFFICLFVFIPAYGCYMTSYLTMVITLQLPSAKQHWGLLWKKNCICYWFNPIISFMFQLDELSSACIFFFKIQNISYIYFQKITYSYWPSGMEISRLMFHSQSLENDTRKLNPNISHPGKDE